MLLYQRINLLRKLTEISPTSRRIHSTGRRKPTGFFLINSLQEVRKSCTAQPYRTYENLDRHYTALYYYIFFV
jgi:hypothetical protein